MADIMQKELKAIFPLRSLFKNKKGRLQFSEKVVKMMKKVQKED